MDDAYLLMHTADGDMLLEGALYPCNPVRQHTCSKWNMLMQAPLRRKLPSCTAPSNRPLKGRLKTADPAEAATAPRQQDPFSHWLESPELSEQHSRSVGLLDLDTTPGKRQSSAADSSIEDEEDARLRPLLSSAQQPSPRRSPSMFSCSPHLLHPPSPTVSGLGTSAGLDLGSPPALAQHSFGQPWQLQALSQPRQSPFAMPSSRQPGGSWDAYLTPDRQQPSTSGDTLDDPAIPKNLFRDLSWAGRGVGAAQGLSRGPTETLCTPLHQSAYQLAQQGCQRDSLPKPERRQPWQQHHLLEDMPGLDRGPRVLAPILTDLYGQQRWPQHMEPPNVDDL